MNRILLGFLQVAGLGLMALLGIVDVTGSMTESPLFPIQVALAIGAAAVWLPHYKPGSILLPTAAIAAAGASLLVTAGLAVTDPYGGLWGLAESTALLITLTLVARNARPDWAVLALVATGAAVSVMPLRSGHSTIYGTFCLIQALGAAGAIGFGVTLRITAGNRQRALDTVRAEQRAEFARDLHDFIAHHVTGIVVQAQGARFIAEQDPKRVLLALEQIEQAGTETMTSMRRMVGVLRDPQSRPDAPLAPVAGVPELAALADQFTAAGGPPARLHLDGDPHGLPVEVSTSAYRVVMEALTNTRQHAPQATAVDIWVRRLRDQLLIRVANDGPAPRPTLDRPGYGLVGLTERVRAAGGRISSGPGVDGGWVVDAVFPIP
ncbi:histidine kinase [Actinoplanes sp. SE50]|uniref:sensor histidine kinase n=1 Tax=unclassified Actinoplanes TaxID=2626549 RepID=UPI00023ECD26|nr:MULTISPECIES: histidine kinase [unclassified Actinoplanes]AEV86032.1 Sensor histidine kinase yxjM [Actinoplanes sp. SE50/110]ATO84430.1 histidine kinase [Actinoplanes sp. SE50]SLM01840.1 two-component system sensor histidine kinase [Actinoplanes sp. SE50/110]